MQYSIPEFSNQPILPDDILKYSKAIISGTAKSVTGFAHMVMHPIDSIIYPVSNLIWDAAILSVAHTEPSSLPTNPDNCNFTILKNSINRNPALYFDAKNRMETRINSVKKAYTDFETGSLEYKVEVISEIVTSIYLPGSIIREVKAVGNLHNFGIVNPPKFHNRGMLDELPLEIPAIKQYSVSDIRSVSGYYKTFLYVFTTDGQLIITPPNSTKPFIRTAKLAGKDWITMDLYHADLAKMKPVYAAGELLVKDGKIIRVNNASGHYIPNGEHLKILIENAFSKHGYSEVVGTYKEFMPIQWAVDPIVTVDKIKINLTPGIIATGLKPIDDDKDVNKDDIKYQFVELSEHFELPNTDKIFIPTEEQKEEFITQARNVGIIFSEMKKETQWDKLSITAKIKLNNVAESLSGFGQLGLSLSQIALMTGGHARTWHGVAAASQSALSLAQGINAITNATTLMSLSAVTGIIGVGIAGIGLAMSLFGEGDNGTQQLMEGINIIRQELAEIRNAIHNMHKDLIEIGKRLEEILIVCILGELNQVNLKLNRLERITTHSFKELHSKELVDIIDTIKKEICGEHKLTNSEKRDFIRRLTTWIDYHSKSQIQTFLVRDNGDKRKMIELLASSDFDIYAMFPLFVNMLSNIVPLSLDIDITNIPNIRVYSAACEVYMLAVRHEYESNTALTQRIIDTYDSINCVVTKLNDKSKIDIFDILQRQYDYFRFQLGSCIAKCRTEYLKNNLNENLSLSQCLVSGQTSESLLDILNELELRRLLLMKFNEVIPNFSSINLESKKDLLQTSLEKFRPDPNIFELARDNKVVEFKRALEMGTNPNVWDGWGMPIHYLTKNSVATGIYYNHDNITLHIMFNHSNIEMSGKTRHDKGDTWGCGANPILHVVNSSKYKMAILFCANGFNISELPHTQGDFNSFNASHIGNLPLWVETPTNIESIITMKFIQQMNKGSILNKTALRKAYDYYKLFESGFFSNITDVSQECLLLLTCILGDLLPFRTLTNDKLNFDINALIPEVGITFIMIAAHSNQVTVVKYLESLGANSKIKSSLVAWKNEENHCLKMAIMSEANMAIEYLTAKNTENVKKQAPLYIFNNWQNNESISVNNSNNDIYKFIKGRIESIKNFPVQNETSKFSQTIENCKLFQNLLNTYRTNHIVFTNLDKVMQNITSKNSDLQLLISAFNNVDAVLRVTVNSKYNLGSKIDLLIDEIKLLL